jgi:hypothetical protein
MREIAEELCTALRNDLPDAIQVVNLCPGPVNVPIPRGRLKSPLKAHNTRRGWIDLHCKTHQVIHLSLHANAAGNSGWYGAKGSVQFVRNDATPGSIVLAQHLYDEMAKTAFGCRYKKVQKKGMAVLKPLAKKGKLPKYPRLAAAMLEAFFMTSQRDVKLAQSDKGKNQIVDACFRAILATLEDLGIDTL